MSARCRKCDACGSVDIWDRELAIDEHGDITTTPAAARFVTSVICWSCRNWLSLGPANDEPAEVQVEIRAAELAAEWDDEHYDVLGMEDIDEEFGRLTHAGDGATSHLHDSECAGYLARVIATHDATHEHEGES